MPQFLVQPDNIQGERFELAGPEAFHVTRVLRRRAGDEVEIFDGKGGRYRGVIREVREDGSISGEILERLNAPRAALEVDLRLYLGVLKASHWEWALEKGTEVGVSTFVPVLTPRTVVQLREQGGAKKARWEKILTAAAKQCKRADIPALKDPVHYRDAIVSAAQEGVTLVAWERHEGATLYAGLKEALRDAREKAAGKLVVHLFVGPEGGFSAEEIELAECEGAKLFSLGPAILRAETAAVAASAIVMYELGSGS